MALRVGLEVGCVQHGKPWTELGQLGRHCPDEHVAHEEGVPRVRGDEPDRQSVGRIGPGKEILHEHLARIQMRTHVFLEPVKRFGIQPGILLPPDLIARPRLLDQKLVLCRAPGVGSGYGGKGAVVGQNPFASPHRMLDERRRSQVGVDPDGEKAVFYEGEGLTRGCCGFGSHALKYRQLQRPMQPHRGATVSVGSVW